MRRSLLALLGLAACAADAPSDTSRLGKTEIDSTICGRVLRSPEPTAIAFEVDCTGIDAFGLNDELTSGETLVPVLGLAEAVPLCTMLLSEPLSAPSQPLGFALGDTTPGKAAITVTRGAMLWKSWDGCMKLAEYTPSRRISGEGGTGVGEYEVVMQEAPIGDTFTPTGRFGIARGRIDWCQYSSRSDCPVQFSSTLAKRVTLDGPGGFVSSRQVPSFRGVDAKATGCRMLIDRASHAVRVDLELGFFRGRPVTQIGSSCFTSGGANVLPNRFVFESGGVDGPGAYGPFARCGDTAGDKPWFSFTAPRSWEASGEQLDCLLGYTLEKSETNPSEASVCTFTISESPGRFEVHCSEARWHVVGRSPGAPQVGDFSLSADCDLSYR